MVIIFSTILLQNTKAEESNILAPLVLKYAYIKNRRTTRQEATLDLILNLKTFSCDRINHKQRYLLTSSSYAHILKKNKNKITCVFLRSISYSFQCYQICGINLILVSSGFNCSSSFSIYFLTPSPWKTFTHQNRAHHYSIFRFKHQWIFLEQQYFTL